MANAFQEYQRAKQIALGQGAQMEQLDMARRKMEMRGRGADAPSAIREWEAFKGMSQPDQERFLEMKRAQKVIDVGGVPTRLRPGGRTQALSSLEREAAGQEKITGAKKVGAEIGKATAEARLALPASEASASELLDLTDKILTHPGLDYAVGKSSVMPILPGTDAADFMTLHDQISGKQFMEAYKTLKGGGQITEVEGNKATQAMARMNRAQTEESYRKGVQDFQKVIRGVLNRTRQRATGSGAQRQAEGLKAKKQQDIKTIGGKTYVKINGQWFAQ